MVGLLSRPSLAGKVAPGRTERQAKKTGRPAKPEPDALGELSALERGMHTIGRDNKETLREYATKAGAKHETIKHQARAAQVARRVKRLPGRSNRF